MTTTVIKTIRASAGDYSSIAAWEANLPANLVTADENHIGEVYNDWPSGHTGQIVIRGQTTDENHTVTLTTATGSGTNGVNFHSGDKASGFHITSGVTASVILDTDNLIFKRIRIVPGTHPGIEVSNNRKVLIDRVYIHDTSSNGINYTDGTTVSNSIITNTSRGIYSTLLTNTTAAVYNCVVTDSIYGILRLIAVNCICYNNSTKDFYQLVGGSGFNASKDTTGDDVGKSCFVSIDSTNFVDITTDNYRLANTSELNGTGIYTNKMTDYDIDDNQIPASRWRSMGYSHRAPVEVIKTLRKSGGDYSSITAWDAALPQNLLTNNERHILECYNDWQAEDGLAERFEQRSRSRGVDVNANNNIIIRTPLSERHDGTPGSGFKLKLIQSYTKAVALQSNYTVFDGIETYANGQNDHGVQMSPWCTLKNGLARISTYRGILLQSHCLVMNYLVEGNNGTAYYYSDYNQYAHIYNCTAINSTLGFRGTSQGGSKPTYINCTAYNCTTDYGATLEAASSNNATDKATAAHSSVTVLNVDSSNYIDTANKDFHLSSSSVLIDAGTNLIVDGRLVPPVLDIDNNTYPLTGPWPIGYNIYTSSAPVTTQMKYGAVTPSKYYVGGVQVQKIYYGPTEIII